MATRPAAKHDPDNFHLALKAMERAAEVARQRARRGRGFLVAWREGRIVNEPVDVPLKSDRPAVPPDFDPHPRLPSAT